MINKCRMSLYKTAHGVPKNVFQWVSVLKNKAVCCALNINDTNVLDGVFKMSF